MATIDDGPPTPVTSSTHLHILSIVEYLAENYETLRDSVLPDYDADVCKTNGEFARHVARRVKGWPDLSPERLADERDAVPTFIDALSKELGHIARRNGVSLQKRPPPRRRRPQGPLGSIP